MAGVLLLFGKPVTCAKYLMIEAHYSATDMPTLDVLLHPGGPGTRPQCNDEQRLAWVRSQRQSVPLMASVYTGALVFAAAGLLAGRAATTHWAWLDRLTELDPSIDVQADKRFVDDSDIITFAGISSGIDLALRLTDPLAAAGPLRLLDGETPLRARRVVATPGHTPEHQGVPVADGRELALITGDLLVHALQLLHPELAYAHKADPETARHSRERMLARGTVSSCHLATPHATEPFLST
ncbi:DJ-1/PfpI family protein [Streptomyces sp. 1222.5]|uniref:DJ-1/PfpI family protein n=1 Tax=Streptomyces sp. 1222.5 TaxID=1881026 RepID=UPI003EB98A16